MKILIASAAPFSGLTGCQDALIQAGLMPAIPFESPAGKITPNQWHQKLLASNGVEGELTSPNGKLAIGKMWEDLAVGILQASMNQGEWGFADECAVWTLDFWANIEPQTRFALGYVSLGQAVALYRQSHADATEENINDLVKAWLDWNTELLAFAQKQGKRAMLFNLQEAAIYPMRLVHTCAKKLGLQKLDWQKLEDKPTPTWPEPEDLANLRLPNLGAVRSLQKKLDSAGTALLNPNTQVMTTPSADKSSGGWSVFGIFGKSKQLTLELNQTRFDLQKAQADLTHAREQLADIETNQKELQIEHQRLTRLASEELAEEKTKATVILNEQKQESDLLLGQLHQVQEELEKIFLDREELKKQLQASEKAKADAQSKLTDLDKKVKDFEKKNKDLGAAKVELDKKLADAQTKASAAEKKAAELDKAKAESDKKAADAQTKASAAEKKAAELDKAKAESDKKAADAQTKASAAEKKAAELDKAKAESDKKAADAQTLASAAEKKVFELATQLQLINTNLPHQTKVLQDAQQENDLLLKQLHQVQEELETYLLKNKETDHKYSQLQGRLDRVLARLTAWADAEVVEATEIVNEKNHRCLRLELQNLWVGQDAPVPKLRLLLGSRDGVPYLEFRPFDKDGKGGVARSLLPWPEEFKDENGDRLLIAPGAPGALGKAQAHVISGLSSSQWRLVKGLLALMGNQVNRLNLRELAERLYWSNITRDLTQQLDAVSTGVHFQSAEVMVVTQPQAGTEVLRVAIRDLNCRFTRVPLCVFELGIKYKTLKSGPSPQMFFLDFRPWKGSVLPFVSFKPNSKDEQGEFLRINMPRTGRNKNNLDHLQLDIQDKQMIHSMGTVLSQIALDQKLKPFTTILGNELWIKELHSMGKALNDSFDVD
jgi:hypothetical protein